MTLTSRERVVRAVAGDETDCLAVMPYLYDVASEIAGVPLIEFYTDPAVMAGVQLQLYERLGQDVICIGSDNFYIAEGFGCRTTRSSDELPALVQPPLSRLEQVFELEVPDPQKEGRMPVMLEALKATRKAVGREVALRSPGTGPFALASYLVGTERWLTEIAFIERGMPEAKEQAVLYALELASEALIRFGKACLDSGADILQCGDSLASCNVISPRTFRRFSFPYCKKVFEAWKSYGAEISLLHICGNSSPVLTDYADTGADILELDTMVDLSLARQLLGSRVTLAGNLDTVSTLLGGTPEKVRTDSEKSIRRACGREGKFLLGTGCLVPRKTPLQNLQAMVSTARQTDCRRLG